MVEQRVEDKVQLVAVAVFKNIGRTLLCAGRVSRIGDIVQVVGLIEGVPVDLTERCLVPEIGIEIVGFLIIGIVGGKIAVVVGARITCIVPVQSRGRVVDRAECETGVERCSRFGFPDPVQDRGGIESLNNLGAALLAVLPAPVGVVEVVVGELICFLVCGRVGGALCRGAPGGEGQRVLRIELFFQ